MFNTYLLAEKLGLLNESFKVMEIGVGPMDKTRLADFISNGYECHMVEGLPRYQKEMAKACGHMANVHIHPFVVSNNRGTEKLYDRGEGSWLTKLPSSPDTQNNSVKIDHKHCQYVKSVTLDMIDPGDLSIVLIDTEGAEWYALEKMVSRPEVIVIETHLEFHPYINPYMDKINAWMAFNEYEILAKELADTMWIKTGA